MNTYGLFAINDTTFNEGYYPKTKKVRDKIITFLKVHNLTLNILGYIPGVSIISGCVRTWIGVTLCLSSTIENIRNGDEGEIVKRFCNEATYTGIAQIVRGAFESIVPFGWVVNAILDGGFTCYNLYKMKKASSQAEGVHPAPNYPHVFKILHLV